MGYPRSENIRRLTRWLELSVRFLEFPFFISPRTSVAAAKKKIRELLQIREGNEGAHWGVLPYVGLSDGYW